jgi:hypothetical protein
MPRLPWMARMRRHTICLTACSMQRLMHTGAPSADMHAMMRTTTKLLGLQGAQCLCEWPGSNTAHMQCYQRIPHLLFKGRKEAHGKAQQCP